MTSAYLSWGAHERTRNFFYEKQMQISQGMFLEVAPRWVGWAVLPGCGAPSLLFSLEKKLLDSPKTSVCFWCLANPACKWTTWNYCTLCGLYVGAFCPVEREGRNNFLPQSAGVMLFSSQISQHTVLSMSAKAWELSSKLSHACLLFWIAALTASFSLQMNAQTVAVGKFFQTRNSAELGGKCFAYWQRYQMMLLLLMSLEIPKLHFEWQYWWENCFKWQL